MKKISITLENMMNLQSEVASLMKEELTFSVKFDLHKVLKKLAPPLETYGALRTEILKKYGKESEEKPGVYHLVPETSEVAIKELTALGNKEEKIEFSPLVFEDFKDLKSKVPYDNIYLLFDEK